MEIKNKSMDQLDALNQVAAFHRTFKHPILSEPTIPSEKRCNLRVELITEELKELQEAIENKDMVEIADALCDIQYVLSGAVLEFGLGDKFRELFDEVQRSNMSKTCKNEEEAIATMAHYKAKDGVDSYYKKSGDFYLVYRTADEKTLKSVNYSPADLKGILQK
ncbi:MAG: putative HAD superfamily Cof-like phosphohydrolase [Saprospiraceae bacterium]|jgi:predicted HAD superfamily Cof-like phosphohydrolase